MLSTCVYTFPQVFPTPWKGDGETYNLGSLFESNVFLSILVGIGRLRCGLSILPFWG